MRSTQRASRRLPTRAGWPRGDVRHGRTAQVFSRLVAPSVLLQPLRARYQIWNFVIPRFIRVAPSRAVWLPLTQPVWTKAQSPPILLCLVDTEGEAQQPARLPIGVAQKVVEVG